MTYIFWLVYSDAMTEGVPTFLRVEANTTSEAVERVARERSWTLTEFDGLHVWYQFHRKDFEYSVSVLE